MIIRNATFRDAPMIKTLLNLLGYKTSISLLISQIENLFNQKDHQVFVYELDKEVVGFIAVHYVPQLGNEGWLAIITYLSVAAGLENSGINKALEEFAVAQALTKKCDHIQVHCMDWWVPHLKFYEHQGYVEYPKFFTKRLNH